MCRKVRFHNLQTHIPSHTCPHPGHPSHPLFHDPSFAYQLIIVTPHKHQHFHIALLPHGLHHPLEIALQLASQRRTFRVPGRRKERIPFKLCLLIVIRLIVSTLRGADHDLQFAQELARHTVFRLDVCSEHIQDPGVVAVAQEKRVQRQEMDRDFPDDDGRDGVLQGRQTGGYDVDWRAWEIDVLAEEEGVRLDGVGGRCIADYVGVYNVSDLLG